MELIYLSSRILRKRSRFATFSHFFLILLYNTSHGKIKTRILSTKSFVKRISRLLRPTKDSHGHTRMYRGRTRSSCICYQICNLRISCWLPQPQCKHAQTPRKRARCILRLLNRYTRRNLHMNRRFCTLKITTIYGSISIYGSIVVTVNLFSLALLSNKNNRRTHRHTNHIWSEFFCHTVKISSITVFTVCIYLYLPFHTIRKRWQL